MSVTQGNMQEGQESGKTEDVKQEVAQVAPSVENVSEPVHIEPMQVTMGILYATVVIVSLMTSVLSVFVYDRFFATRIGTYDLPGHVLWLRNNLVAKMQSGAINEQQAQELMAKDLEGVNTIIKALPRNVIVISGDTVIGSPKRLITIPDTAAQGKTNAPGAADGQAIPK